MKYHEITTALLCPMKYHWSKTLVPHNKESLRKIIYSAFSMFQRGFTKDECSSFIANTFAAKISAAPEPDQEDLIVKKWTALGLWTNFPFDRKEEIRLTYALFDKFEKVLAFSNEYTCILKDKNIESMVINVIRLPALSKRETENGIEFAMRCGYDYKFRPLFYYKKMLVRRTKKDFDRWEKDALAIKIYLETIEKTPFRNTAACCGKQDCDYLKICFDEDELKKQLYYTEVKNGPA